MKTLQTHWRSMVSVMVVVLLGSALAWHSTTRGAAALQDPQDPVGFDAMSRVDHDALRNLLAEVSLQRDALIALNPSSTQAESILAAARSWRETNAAALATLKATMDRKVCAVRKIEKAIRMGPADPTHEQQLAVARQELADSKAAREVTLTSLQTTVSGVLSESQRATWLAIRQGWGRQMAFQMLDLSDTQRLALSRAQRTYKRQRAAARTAEQRTAAQTAWASALDAILTVDQKSVRDAYHNNYDSASSAVAAALDTVLVVNEG